MTTLLQINKIKNQLARQPIEDVYSMHFAGKIITEELFDIYSKSFNHSQIETSTINKEKIRIIKECVVDRYYYYGINRFPRFIELYIKLFYSVDGLRSGNPEDHIVILDKELQVGENIENYIKSFESRILSKKWWTDQDDAIFKDFHQKRMVVEEFENYLLDLFDDLFKPLDENEGSGIQEAQKVYKRHINNIKYQIAYNKLFNLNTKKIVILEKVINYIEALSNTEIILPILRADEVERLAKTEQNLKINLLHQFGIIEFLNKVWKRNNIVRPMEHLLSTLLNEKSTSIQPRLSNKEDKKLRTTAGNQKLEKYLEVFGLVPDQIKRP